MNINFYIVNQCNCYQIFYRNLIFFLSEFSFKDTDDSQNSRGREGGDHRLFHSATSTSSRTLRHLFATLHARWLSRIFNRNACVYQTARWLDEIYHLIEISFDWLMMQCFFVYLMNWFQLFVTVTWHGKTVDLKSHQLPLFDCHPLTVNPE